MDILNGGGGNGGYNEYKPIGFGDDGSDGASMAEHYKKMVEDNPGNTLLLRNYAEFLHKVNIKTFIFSTCIIITHGSNSCLVYSFHPIIIFMFRKGWRDIT